MNKSQRRRRSKNKSADTPETDVSSESKSPSSARGVDTPLRVIGGQLKGRKLEYSGDPRTRPMKDRVREAVFNLIGPPIKGMQAIDLFAGTGAVAIEALSRGASSAIAIERHFPSADLIKQNGRSLGISDQLNVLAGDTFIWVKRLLGGQSAAIALPELYDGPWAVFCCPPYALYHDRSEDMLELIGSFHRLAPAGSCLIVEADQEFDYGTLVAPDSWDVRSYLPAVVGISRTT